MNNYSTFVNKFYKTGGTPVFSRKEITCSACSKDSLTVGACVLLEIDMKWFDFFT